MCEDRNTVWPWPSPPGCLAERLLHQRIETAGRLIQDQQVGAAISAAIRLIFCRLPFEYARTFLTGRSRTAGELVAVRRFDAAVHPAQQVQGLGARQRRPQVGSPGT